MEDMALKWISTLGFPIFACGAVTWALLKIFAMWQAAVAEAREAAAKVASLAQEHSHVMMSALDKNSKAMEGNTRAAQEQTDYLKKFGSDPTGLCKVKDSIEEMKKIIVANGFQCPSESMIKVIHDNIMRKKAAARGKENNENHHE